jgi:hypothetical protein
MKRLLLVVLTAASVMIPSGAHAATQSNYTLSYCSAGTHRGSAYADATNGRLSVGWCSNADKNKATTITVKYLKVQGSAISAQFGYEWTDTSGINTGGRHWDSTGHVTIQPNTTWGARFNRSPAEARPSSALKCIRGLMRVGSNNVLYSTRIVCP